jgi:hypothetical protein
MVPNLRRIRKAVPGGGVRTPIDAGTRQAALYGANNIMGPGEPLKPVDAQPLRVFDFRVAQNIQITPRSSEAWSFHQLRSFSNQELVRLAIETRKDQIERLDWQIKVKGTSRPNRLDLSAIRRVEAYLAYPDRENDFAAWVRMLGEDLLAIDAASIERVRSRKGDIYCHSVVDGTTIKPLIDFTGRRITQPGVAAYQQIIKGRVWCDLTIDDLFYMPRNMRSGHIYGYSIVEQVIVTINTAIQRQTMQLNHFTEGNVPAGLLSAPSSWNPDQIRQYQDWFDARLAGQLEQKNKLIAVPDGVKYQNIKEAPLKDDFDEWLARVVMYAFSLPPTPFIRQMNRTTSASDQERSQEEGLEPMKRWFKRQLDRIIQIDLGETNLEFEWLNASEIDPKVQAEIDNVNVRNATATIDEVREGRGLDPLPNGMGSKPLLFTTSGAMTLEDALTKPDPAGAQIEPPTPLHTNDPETGSTHGDAGDDTSPHAAG